MLDALIADLGAPQAEPAQVAQRLKPIEVGVGSASIAQVDLDDRLVRRFGVELDAAAQGANLGHELILALVRLGRRPDCDAPPVEQAGARQHDHAKSHDSPKGYGWSATTKGRFP